MAHGGGNGPRAASWRAARNGRPTRRFPKVQQLQAEHRFQHSQRTNTKIILIAIPLSPEAYL